MARAPVLHRASRHDALVRELRARFREHNRRVLLLAALTFCVAAGLWYVAYAVLYWLALLAASVRHGLDARPQESLPAFFIYGAGLLILITWLARHWSPDDTPRDDKSALQVAADFLLAVPRATLAVWGNLSAYQRLNAAEIALAALLVEHLAAEPRLPLHALPLLVPDRASRERIILALQLVQLIDLHRADGFAGLRLSSFARRALLFSPKTAPSF